MLLLLIFSTLMGVFVSSWVMVWVSLEINTVIMCWMISKEENKEKMQKTPSMIYFLVQMMASSMVLICLITQTSPMSMIMLNLALVTKLGGWPFHLWYMKLISIMNLSSNCLFLLLTWQKILPLILLLNTINKNNTICLMVLVTLMSIISPMIKLNKNLSFKSIIALSSMNNNGWLLLCLMSSNMVFMMFLSLYSLTLKITLSTMSDLITKKMSLNKQPMEILMVVANMGGMPPLTMFWAKLKVLTEMMKSNLASELVCTILVMAVILLYHYLWATILEIMKKPEKAQNFKQSKSMKKILASSMISMMLAILL